MGPQDPAAFARGAASIPPAARPHAYDSTPSPVAQVCTSFTDDGVVYTICN
jgi:hypothetical protein